MGNKTVEYRENSISVRPLQGGAMGFVSGFKGGAVAGAIGSAILMVQAMIGDGPNAIIVFSAIFGATTGLMAGGIIGGALGVLSGWLGSRIHNAGGEPRYIWFVISTTGVVALGVLSAEPGSKAIATVIGILLGLWAGRISSRDFEKIMAQQYAAADEE